MTDKPQKHAQVVNTSSDDISDHEADTFEGARNASNIPDALVSPCSMRSLTQRPRSTSSLKDLAEATVEVAKVAHRKEPVNGTAKEVAESTKSFEGEDATIVQDQTESNHAHSPLLTARRPTQNTLDNAALDEIVLGEEAEETSSHVQGLAPHTEQPPALPPKSPGIATTTLQGFTGALPSVPWNPPPPTPPLQNPPATAPSAPLTRKLTSPFTWFPRGNKEKDTITSPPLTAVGRGFGNRRDTNSSVATLSSNPELMLSKLDGTQDVDGGRRAGRNSLRDRFKLLRMRDEAGISLTEDEKGETHIIDHRNGPDKPQEGQALASPLAPMPTSPNPLLAPGTAAGVSAPLPDPSGHVDWDLWQAVVYEGPVAVARSSPEELNKAIATGIPSAIRGVVWQVLAQSQSPELEIVYRELVARGTDKDRNSVSGTVSSGSNGSVHGNGQEKDSIVSSSSSVHSDHSVSAMNGVRSSTPPSEKDVEMLGKLNASIKQKTKEDAAALVKLEKAIKRDLGARTSYSKFAASAGLQNGLFGVCKAYALYDEGVGYAQGINFLAMPLLFNMPEEEAFCLLVRMMNHYHLRDLFIQDMPGLHMHLYLFERLLEDLEPALYCHLHRKQVSPHLYATQWFLTLFVYRFPLQLVLRIYDLILSEGLAAILKFGLVLMQKNAATLLGMDDMMALTTFLKDKLFDVYIDKSPSAGSILESGFFGSAGSSIDKEVYRADVLVQDACAVKICPEILKTYTLEWEEKTRMEREREAELETLRNVSNNLGLKVRKLEERSQQHDADHAALATQLVRTKVENEELKDENESLKTEVVELKKIVESLPAEVEGRFKEQMEATQARNQEVHLLNSKLEEELAAMEKVLVETKMKCAESDAEKEALQRKMADFRKALN